MTKSIKKTYRWKRLTEDGLLKEPKELGPSYNSDSLNDWSGYDSEEDAQTRLLELDDMHPYDIDSNLLLVTVYNIYEED